MYVPSNDPRAAQFTILPKNGSLFLTLNDDSLVYVDYCVDRGFKNNALANSTKAALAGFGQLATSNAYAFLGSVVAFCQPGKRVRSRIVEIFFSSTKMIQISLRFTCLHLRLCAFLGLENYPKTLLSVGFQLKQQIAEDDHASRTVAHRWRSTTQKPGDVTIRFVL